MHKHILIPTDGSELADHALSHALALAKLQGSKVTVVRVTNPPAPLVYEGVVVPVPTEEVRAEVAKRVEEHFATVRAKAAAEGLKIETVQVEADQPWEAIIETAKSKGADLIVMASHGRRGLSAVLLGSETQKVLTHSTIPVLVCR